MGTKQDEILFILDLSLSPSFPEDAGIKNFLKHSFHHEPRFKPVFVLTILSLPLLYLRRCLS